MKTFAKLLAVVMALLMVLSIVACTKPAEDPEKKDPTTEPTSEPTAEPTVNPTTEPTGEPTAEPTAEPTPESPLDSAFVYVPTADALRTGVTYEWGSDGATLDFTGSKLVPTVVADIADADAKAAIEGKADDGFIDAVIAIKGAAADTYVLPGITKAGVSSAFVAGYKFVFKMNVYTKAAANVSFVGVTAEGNTELKKIELAAGFNTVEVVAKITDAITGFAFVTEGATEIYLGLMDVTLFDVGPTEQELLAGYTYDWTELMDLTKDYGDIVKVAEIEDDTIRTALQNGGAGEYVQHHTGGEAVPLATQHYVTGRKYTVSITYYAKSAGGYFIAIGDGNNNNTVKAGLFAANAYKTVTFEWEVSTRPEHQIIYYSCPEVYIVSFSLKMADPNAPEIYSKRENDYHALTAAEFGDGYTFDFSAGNAMNFGVKAYIDVANIENDTVRNALTDAEGFGTSVAHLSDTFSNINFGSIEGMYVAGKTVTVKLRAYLVNTDIVNSPRNMVSLPYGSAGQEGELNPTFTQVEGNFYDVTYSIACSETMTRLFIYTIGEYNLYVGNVYVSLK